MWSETVKKLQVKYEVELLPPKDSKSVELIIKKLGLGDEFIDFYNATNGLTSGWFSMLPIRDDSNIKRTWDSLERANAPKASKFELTGDFLERFVAFAAVGLNECALYDKSDGSIWYEEDNEFHQTDLSLEEFVELCLKEVKDL